MPVVRRRSQWRPLAAALLTIGLVASACSATDSEPILTTTTTTTSPPATTTSSSTTTTTLPFVEIAVQVDDDPEVATLLGGFYTWVADRDAPQPDLPVGLAGHLAELQQMDPDSLRAELTTEGVVGMGVAGVATIEEEDIILLVNDFDATGENLTGWRIVGAWLVRHDLDPWFGDPIRHVMIIGTDARDWQDPVRFRADSLHIVSSNTVEGGGGILGFPRDSWIEAPYGTDKYTHVNAITWTASDKQVAEDLDRIQTEPYLGYAARWLGLDRVIEMIREGPLGAEVTVDIAEQLTGLPLDGYFLTGFRDFQLLLNDYGGIEIDVPFAMADASSGAYFKAGVQEMWGRWALAFSRNRHLRGGDFTRSLHQGLVILARLNGAIDSGFSMLPWLVSGLVKNTWTDLSLEQILTLGAGALLLDPDNVGNKVLPGRVATRAGASVVLIADSAEELYRDLDDGMLEVDLPNEE
jgi:LCP family protein required for cell wall assembly